MTGDVLVASTFILNPKVWVLGKFQKEMLKI